MTFRVFIYDENWQSEIIRGTEKAFHLQDNEKMDIYQKVKRDINKGFTIFGWVGRFMKIEYMYVQSCSFEIEPGPFYAVRDHFST